MKKSFKKSEYFLAGLLALVAAFPLAVEPPASAKDIPLTASVTATTEKQRALDNYANYRDARRDYAKARTLCIQLRANGKEVTCPDVNDRAGILHLLATHENLKAAAASTGAVLLRESDLTLTQSNLLRRYQKINACPDRLNEYLPGFLELCRSLLNPNPVLYRAILSPDAVGQMSDVPQYTLDDFIQATMGIKRTR